MAYTQLAPTAIPGRRYSFVAKFAATGPHIGTFTALSVMALPGPLRSFLAKTEVIIIPPVIPPTPSGGGGGGAYAYARDYAEYDSKYKMAEAHRQKVLRDDEELLEILAMVLNIGILE